MVLELFLDSHLGFVVLGENQEKVEGPQCISLYYFTVLI